jgi:hypothetical protein
MLYRAISLTVSQAFSLSPPPDHDGQIDGFEVVCRKRNMINHQHGGLIVFGP